MRSVRVHPPSLPFPGLTLAQFLTHSHSRDVQIPAHVESDDKKCEACVAMLNCWWCPSLRSCVTKSEDCDSVEMCAPAASANDVMPDIGESQEPSTASSESVLSSAKSLEQVLNQDTGML